MKPKFQIFNTQSHHINLNELKEQIIKFPGLLYFDVFFLRYNTHSHDTYIQVRTPERLNAGNLKKNSGNVNTSQKYFFFHSGLFKNWYDLLFLLRFCYDLLIYFKFNLLKMLKTNKSAIICNFYKINNEES